MIDEKSRLQARRVLDDYLAAHNMRRTPERYAILDKVQTMKRHFSLSTIGQLLDDDGYPVSRSTLYLALDMLCDAGLVRRHRLGRAAQYERVDLTATANHLHLVCSQCGKVKEVVDPELTTAINQRGFSAFHPSSFSLYIYGICSTCSRRRRRNNALSQTVDKKKKTQHNAKK